MRIHLGHHFYGAGNLGDDFMLAGFLGAMRTLAPHATFTCCVPFPLDPLRQRFPSITWLACDEPTRSQCIAACDLWLGLGGSPFQHGLSRWFVDHLVSEASLCARASKPMFYLGVGVQTATELTDPDVHRICAQAAAIWTRDPASAERLATLSTPPPVASAADLAHLFFRSTPPPHARTGRLTVVANFDYGAWPGQSAFLRATHPASSSLRLTERVWLSQESRDLPGAERALHAALSPSERTLWHLVIPDLPDPSAVTIFPPSADSPANTSALFPSASRPSAPANNPTPTPSLASVFARWPSGEWLVTARFHAALAGAWAGSKIVILSTNEKLRTAARELSCPLLATDADEATVTRTLLAATTPSDSSPSLFPSAPAPLPFSFDSAPPAVPSVAPSLLAAADCAYAAVAAFVQAASSFSSPPPSNSSSSSVVAPTRPTP